MVAYSFQAQFVAPILNGTKRQTIRPERKGRSRHARPGDELQLYTGMRTKHCRLIARAVCESVSPIAVNFAPLCSEVHVDGTLLTSISGRPSALIAMNNFARRDGFRDWPELKQFWRHHHPGVDHFEGVLIRWKTIRRGDDGKAR